MAGSSSVPPQRVLQDSIASHNASLAPIQEGNQPIPVDSLPPQLPNTSTAHFQADSRILISSYHNENPASGSLCPAQMNYGRGMVVEGNAPDRVPSLTRSEILNPASVAYDNQNYWFRFGTIVHNLHQGCNNPPGLPHPSTGHLQIDSTSPISSSLKANPASSSFCSAQMINCERVMPMHATDTLPLQAFLKPMIPNNASVAYKDRTLKPHFGSQNSHTFSFVSPLQPSNEGHSNNGQISRSNKGLAPVSWQAQNSARCILKLFMFLSEDKIYGYIFPRLVSKLEMILRQVLKPEFDQGQSRTQVHVLNVGKLRN
ncbi:hypothetical protein POTOM_042761 [Populus tomentosa]|uniref:Uncharacterized protein n=1 Tax=Populus tomentosa TaxID=118781 RepID=A0A8X7YX91_POPTO|nr:hypothetical protein POTOM_042761 [Populus tomentosa]